jgi:hypothetical protein
MSQPQMLTGTPSAAATAETLLDLVLAVLALAPDAAPGAAVHNLTTDPPASWAEMVDEVRAADAEMRGAGAGTGAWPTPHNEADVNSLDVFLTRVWTDHRVGAKWLTDAAALSLPCDATGFGEHLHVALARQAQQPAVPLALLQEVDSAANNDSCRVYWELHEKQWLLLARAVARCAKRRALARVLRDAVKQWIGVVETSVSAIVTSAAIANRSAATAHWLRVDGRACLLLLVQLVAAAVRHGELLLLRDVTQARSKKTMAMRVKALATARASVLASVRIELSRVALPVQPAITAALAALGESLGVPPAPVTPAAPYSWPRTDHRAVASPPRLLTKPVLDALAERLLTREGDAGPVLLRVAEHLVLFMHGMPSPGMLLLAGSSALELMSSVRAIIDAIAGVYPGVLQSLVIDAAQVQPAGHRGLQVSDVERDIGALLLTGQPGLLVIEHLDMLAPRALGFDHGSDDYYKDLRLRAARELFALLARSTASPLGRLCPVLLYTSAASSEDEVRDALLLRGMPVELVAGIADVVIVPDRIGVVSARAISEVVQKHSRAAAVLGVTVVIAESLPQQLACFCHRAHVHRTDAERAIARAIGDAVIRRIRSGETATLLSAGDDIIPLL